MTSLAGKPRFDWPRFWAEQSGTISLADGGYLVDPSFAKRHGQTELQTLSDLSRFRGLALLGEPGMGKSVALETEAARHRAAPEDGFTVAHFNLRAFSSDVLLYHKIFEDPKVQAWKDGSGQLILQLDSLDEALLRIETVAALIADELQALPADRLSIRIACRTVTWQTVAPTLMPVFKTLWGEKAAGAFEIAPLRRADVLTAAAQWPVDADAFMKQVRIANAVPFAVKPLTLSLLLRLFHADGHLPDKIAELYRQGCLGLCEEQSANRLAAGRDSQLAPRERLALAGRMAAVSMLANRYAIYTGPESQPAQEEDVALTVLAVGSEFGLAGPIPLTRETLRETLDTGLFSSRGDDRMGWAHQSFAEFLAADYLISRKVPASNVLAVLRHPSGGLVPQLSMIAAWAASLDAEIRRELIEQEPIVLLHGDLAGWEAGDLSALTTALLFRLDEKLAHDGTFGLTDRYRKLVHPALADLLRPYVLGGVHGVIARRVAMRIAEACSVRNLEADLLTVALDADAEPHIRACAVSALSTCGDERAWQLLRPLALNTPGPDWDREIKAAALEILWPGYLQAQDLFAHLTAPKENFFGAYEVFLNDVLPKTLKRVDLPTALGWATGFVRGTNHHSYDFARRRLADLILMAAWIHIKDPEITPQFVRYTQAAFAAHYKLLVGHDRDDHTAFHESVASDNEGRRAFLRAALAAPHNATFSFSLSRSGLLQRDDLAWLLSLAPGSKFSAEDVDERALCDFVQSVADFHDEAHFAALYDAAWHWPLLRSKYSGVFDGVPLNSSIAAELKKHNSWETDHVRSQRPKVDPPPTQRVRECLDRFDNGQVDAWSQMNLELTLEPDSTHYGSWLDYRITAMPGWTEADEETRSRILVSALQYLERSVPTVDQWLGKNTVNHSDLAAFRALVLLRELLPGAYCELDPALWRKWAPLTIAVPQDTGTDKARLHQAIVADATVVAAAEVAATVVNIIQAEKLRQRASETSLRDGVLPFSVLRQLDPKVRNEALTTGVLQELADEANTPQQFEALLEPLFEANVVAARDLAVRLFEVWPCPGENRDRALSAAAALLEHFAVAAWSRLWSVFEVDADFGREVILRVARFHGQERAFFVNLGDLQLGELYAWLSRVFPHEEDPIREDGPHWVSPRDSVVHLRDDVLRALSNRGTSEAVAALRLVVACLPNLPWLAYRLVDAEQLMRRRTWLPLTPVDVLRLVERPDASLVQSAGQLADLLVAVLRRYERELHGEQAPVRALWDRQASGALLRPVEEDAISDHVKLYLQRELVIRGMVINREVEVGRAPGAPIGKRTDIRVNAVRRTANAKAYDEITAVIETKGCWNAELMTAMQTQLKDDYLKRLGAPIGIYMVGWFDKPKWDPADRRKSKSPSWDVAKAQQRLDEQASGLSVGFMVRAVVLDCHAP